jgi:DNA-binding transcriptional MerR regulator
MYGIGTVARLAQVSVRTLRHYDDLGLLRPAWVNSATGYRYYTPDQVLRLHRILVLRDLGVPLSEIGQLVDDDVMSSIVNERRSFSGASSSTPPVSGRCSSSSTSSPRRACAQRRQPSTRDIRSD